MRKLIGMTEFVLEQEKDVFGDVSAGEAYTKMINYAKFLSQPLTLGMFVPTDENGVVLEEPKGTDLYNSFFEIQVDYNSERLYNEAKERVMFEGFALRCPNAITNGNISITFTKSGGVLLDRDFKDHFENIGIIGTIEDLTKYSLELTPSANKIINN